MAFSMLSIPGVNGGISTEYSFWRGFTFAVDGERVKPSGFPRNRLTFPGTAGPVEAQVKGGLLRAHPTLVVGETDYPTGPPTPRSLQIIALLPLLALLLVQGALGFLMAFGAVAINKGIVRGELSNQAKAALMCGTLLAAIAIDVAIVLALY